MSRSPLAYPLNRGVDGDAGGAADLQTDIMRFMAILALCLVAIFALVQSIPLAPPAPRIEAPEPDPVSVPVPETPTATAPAPASEPVADPQPVEVVRLTRPKWQPRQKPEPAEPVTPVESQAIVTAPVPEPPPEAAPPAQPVGFTLRFESDLALTRLVAANNVGFYAISGGRAQRMAVSNSRISFWHASTPNAFHEMEAATVPQPVIKALTQAGADPQTVAWGVTLPGKLSRQLETVMRDNEGGSLVIGIDGELRLETQ